MPLVPGKLHCVYVECHMWLADYDYVPVTATFEHADCS